MQKIQRIEGSNMKTDQIYSEQLGLFSGRPYFEVVTDTYIPACHLHKAIECVYVIQGRMSILVNNVMVSAKEKEMLFIPGRAMHEYPRPSGNIRFAKFKFLPEWLYPPFQSEQETEEIKKLLQNSFTIRQNGSIDEIIEDLVNHSPNDPYSDYFVLAKLFELFSVILTNKNLVQTIIETEKSYPRYFEEILEYIHQHVHERITLRDVAVHIGITEGYCSKYIKKVTGMSFVEYVNTVRVNDAQRLLSNTDLGILEVMEIAGFGAVSTFNRVFKKATGVSPKQYRKDKHDQKKADRRSC